MNNGVINGNISIAGIGFPVRYSQQDEGAITHSVTAPKAYAGVTTSGVGTKTGSVTTTNAAPDIELTDYVDIYWDGGALFNVNVSAKTAGLITFAVDSNSDGDVLPADGTAMIVAVCQVVAGEFEGADVSMMFVKASNGRSHVAFVEGDQPTGTNHFSHDVPDDEGWFWTYDLAQWINNPITGHTIDHIWVSTADTTSDQTITVAVLYDSVG